MAAARMVLIVGAGIGGLTAALALAQRGFGVTLFDQAPQLEEVGAGLQLSPNASAILIALGLRAALEERVVAPQELRVLDAASARVLTRAPLGDFVRKRYGAPYWVIHRGDLQAVLLAAVRAHPGVTLHLGTRVEDFALHANAVTLSGSATAGPIEARGAVLIGADGLWSALRPRIGERGEPRFAQHTAWRLLVPTDAVISNLATPTVNLWLGRDAHLVHYPVSAGRQINVVAIVRDEWREAGWNAPGMSPELLARYRAWPGPVRALLGTAGAWKKWALFDRAPFDQWGKGPVTLLGDAAHPMLPFLAQGAAMAIEDAAVLARRLADKPDDAAAALRHYERDRRDRTARAQQSARSNGRIYHMGGPATFLRALVLGAMGGTRLLTRYDWLYGWKPS
ncbi:MAG: FAD-dependent monooxygenase [Hyphomicrobiales bacterium]|nr:FAD-dependent monooxygenase [Hyphomicrobiales bacterium]